MTLPETVRDAVAGLLGPIRDARAVGGGSVGASAYVRGAGGAVFVKWADGTAAASFAAEADGLLRVGAVAPEDLVVPLPLSVGAGAPGWIVLPWLEPARPDAAAWRRFGGALAALHAAPPAVADPARPYGQPPAGGWIGSKPQAGGWAADWPTFFGERRLLAQAAVVRARGAWEARWDAPLARVVARLPEWLPARPPPATLHGDLWAGNALALADGRFALVDPAAYVGHAEADIGMTELFGGFAPGFYAGYREAAGPGDADAHALYNLYHLINHLTHGPGYAGAVEAVLRRFA